MVFSVDSRSFTNDRTFSKNCFGDHRLPEIHLAVVTAKNEDLFEWLASQLRGKTVDPVEPLLGIIGARDIRCREGC